MIVLTVLRNYTTLELSYDICELAAGTRSLHCPRDQVRQYSQEKLMPRILLDNRNERKSNHLQEDKTLFPPRVNS